MYTPPNSITVHYDLDEVLNSVENVLEQYNTIFSDEQKTSFIKELTELLILQADELFDGGE